MSETTKGAGEARLDAEMLRYLRDWPGGGATLDDGRTRNGRVQRRAVKAGLLVVAGTSRYGDIYVLSEAGRAAREGSHA